MCIELSIPLILYTHVNIENLVVKILFKLNLTRTNLALQFSTSKRVKREIGGKREVLKVKYIILRIKKIKYVSFMY